MTSDEHFEKALEVGSGVDMTSMISDTDDPAVAPIRMADNTIWYPCEICDCKMNSMKKR